MEIDLLNIDPAEEQGQHKLKQLVQSPESFFMDVKCPQCQHVNTIFSHPSSVCLPLLQVSYLPLYFKHSFWHIYWFVAANSFSARDNLFLARSCTKGLPHIILFSIFPENNYLGMSRKRRLRSPYRSRSPERRNRWQNNWSRRRADTARQETKLRPLSRRGRTQFARGVRAGDKFLGWAIVASAKFRIAR